MADEAHRSHARIGLFVMTVSVALALRFAFDTAVATAVSSLLTFAAAATAVSVGIRRYHPADRVAWMLPVASLAFFATGDSIRGSTGYADLSGSVVPDIFTVAAYFALFGATVKGLHPKSILGGNTDAYLDLASIVLGGFLLSRTILVSPALHDTEWPTGAKATVVAAYPIFDVVLLVLLVYSLITIGPAGFALRAVQCSVAAIIGGNLSISAAAAGIVEIPDHLLSVPFLVAIIGFGSAALHPTMSRIGARPPIDPDKLRQRSLVMIVTLLATTLAVTIGGPLRPGDRYVIGPLLALLVGTVLYRNERTITRLRRERRRADRDPLTGLRNRGALIRAFDDASRTERRCLMFVDLNGFKAVNDGFGHAAGDELLQTAADRIRSEVRREDVVARFGGDEFVVLTSLDRTGASALAERLAAALGRPFDLRGHTATVTASVGVATLEPGIDDGWDTVLRRADAAMYRAKSIGDGMIVFHDQLPDGQTHGRRRVLD